MLWIKQEMLLHLKMSLCAETVEPGLINNNYVNYKALTSIIYYLSIQLCFSIKLFFDF